VWIVFITSKRYGWQSILLWPFNRSLLRHCKRLSKQAYRSAVNWLFVRIFWTSVRCRPTSNCRCCLLMSNSTPDARHFAVTDQPRWPCRRQHRLVRPMAALRARIASVARLLNIAAKVTWTCIVSVKSFVHAYAYRSDALSGEFKTRVSYHVHIGQYQTHQIVTRIFTFHLY